MSINIRCAELKDIDTLTQLHVKLLDFEGIKEKDEKKIKWAFQKIINSKDACIILIEYFGNITGMCSLHTLISSVEGGLVALIEDVYIDEQYRKIGLGMKLMKEVVEFCKKENYKRIQLLCRTDNKNAIRFYEKLGFTGIDRIFFYKRI
jgi:ribosomal protein S18 acetylase RimI-like enzyme